MRRTVTVVYWFNSQPPTHAPDVCLCPIILLSLHHLWRCVHVRTTICVEKFRFPHVSSKTKICQKGDTLYHCMTIIRYHNRYPHISKNKKHTNVHVYIVIKALVLFFFRVGAYPTPFLPLETIYFYKTCFQIDFGVTERILICIQRTDLYTPSGEGGVNCLWTMFLFFFSTLQIPDGSGCVHPPPLPNINPCMLSTYKKSSNFKFYHLPINLRLKQESSIRFSNLMSRWQMFSEWR